jgi:hypothetical protein
MSILIIEVLPQGMIFAADRNVTVTREMSGDSETIVYQAQEIGSKIVRWPHERALVGAVGLGEISGQSVYDWLYDFVGDHVDFGNPETVALDLRDRLQDTVGRLDPPERLIVEFGTFTQRDGTTVPEMWHITNVHGWNNQTGEYDPPTKTFGAAEQICAKQLKDTPPNEIRAELQTRAASLDPSWFHQGINLTFFNVLEQGVKAAFRTLLEIGKLEPPRSLKDWERHAQMWVLVYGAYFEAFGEPGERLVGGGADVLSIPWPEN